MNIRIPITKLFLPPLEEYRAYLAEIWEREWLTNDGPLVQLLEERLQEYLGVENLLYVSNSTSALQFDIKSLKLEGEIITTPFSYIATTSSTVWEGCRPVFADIDPGLLNLDPSLIEESVTPATSAILATHVFGNPCDISSIMKVAKKHNLKVKFDAPHCFGTTYVGESVYRFGDISTTSFHTTKVFQTRRYFFPSLAKLEYVEKQTTPVCSELAPRVLCLPLYHELQPDEQKEITEYYIL